MSRWPYAQQFVHKALANIGYPGEVYLYGLKISVQAIQKPPRLTPRDERGTNREQLDHRPRSRKGVIASELAENVSKISLSRGIYLAHH